MILHWKLVAKDYNTEGTLTIEVKPKIIDEISVESEEPFEDEVRIENYFGQD